jgi:hypothetical protein
MAYITYMLAQALETHLDNWLALSTMYRYIYAI